MQICLRVRLLMAHWMQRDVDWVRKGIDQGVGGWYSDIQETEFKFGGAIFIGLNFEISHLQRLRLTFRQMEFFHWALKILQFQNKFYFGVWA